MIFAIGPGNEIIKAKINESHSDSDRFTGQRNFISENGNSMMAVCEQRVILRKLINYLSDPMNAKITFVHQ